jgi:H+-translocating NAD(P) transhydrogenase subunit alpha
MTIGVLKEPAWESRVSLLPEQVSALCLQGIQIRVETGAGIHAFASDQAYHDAGALVAIRSAVLEQEVLLAMHLPLLDFPSTSLKDKVLLGAYQPLSQMEAMSSWAAEGVSLFSLDLIPRTTRAQSMDVLSSQASIAGYKAVLLGADLLPRYFPMLMTAAGTITPARVLILGAGVAGLQAIATARRLGAVVEVFDTRPQVREEVQSLGARFIEVEGAADASGAGGYAVTQTEAFQVRQRQRIAEAATKADVIITTAQIPGKAAPLLITEDMLDAMRPGSVIVDLAAGTGGNTPYTEDGQTVRYKDVRIVGNSSLASTMPIDSSRLYGKNISQFLRLLKDKAGALRIDFSDDLVKGCCITYGGEVVHERVKVLIS